MCIHKGQSEKTETWVVSMRLRLIFFFSSKPNLNIVTLVCHSGIERWKEHIHH